MNKLLTVTVSKFKNWWDAQTSFLQ